MYACVWADDEKWHKNGMKIDLCVIRTKPKMEKHLLKENCQNNKLTRKHEEIEAFTNKCTICAWERERERTNQFRMRAHCIYHYLFAHAIHIGNHHHHKHILINGDINLFTSLKVVHWECKESSKKIRFDWNAACEMIVYFETAFELSFNLMLEMLVDWLLTKCTHFRNMWDKYGTILRDESIRGLPCWMNVICLNKYYFTT